MKALLGISLLLAGCISAANRAEVNSIRSDQLKTRAAFDLKCDASALAITDLTPKGDPYMRIAGVDGCDKRATYAWDFNRSMWFMDAASVSTPSHDTTPAAEAQKEAQP